MKQVISFLVLFTLAYLIGCNAQTTIVGNGAQFVAGVPPTFPAGSITASAIGNQGSRTFYYWVVVHYPIGTTLVNGPVMATKVADVLSVSNYVKISYPPLAKATGYDVLRTLTNSFPGGTNTIAVAINTGANVVNNQSDTLTSYTYAPSVNPAVANITLNNLDYPNPFLLVDTPIHDLTVANLNVTTSYTGVGGGGGGCGAICNVTTLNASSSVNTPTVNATDVVATGTVTGNIGSYAASVQVGQTGSSPGVLEIDDPNTFSINTIKSGNQGNTIPLKLPPTAPFDATTNNFAVDQGPTRSSPLVCNGFTDADGDYECRFGSASVPMGSNSDITVTKNITANQYYTLQCLDIPKNALNATSLNRDLKMYATGVNSMAAGKSPQYQIQVSLFTNNICTTGATVLGTFDIVPGLGALSSAPWTATIDTVMNTLTSFVPSGTWNIVASAASPTSPTSRILSSNTPVTFDPTTCTANHCGIALQVTANGGFDASINYSQIFGSVTMF